ncbi:Kazal-type serine protease inhibitor domain [Nesidiocoris tenuis]|uniref:Kazal-type serine protease inhibitor domain n=1 Tax=Nesidiocoris tenuis TaxID=355587 RepID=A0ABN7B946_9HEMI|nr:Kazal-type serine protease inhibitor domain [Nesidiocoris tenuis]
MMWAARFFIVLVAINVCNCCYLAAGGKDPCENVKCRPGARCAVSPAGEPSCQCPTSCPDYGDHSGSRPVCGADAVDYKDLCSINMASCSVENGVQLKYHGPCDPCAGVVCPDGQICLVTEGRVARCSCPETCSLEGPPICATDGQTYSNECNMRLEACRTRKRLAILYRDSCSSGVNPCSGMECEHGSYCLVDKEGRANCECPPPCEEVMRPVCGTDGVTYDSACHLKRQMCLDRGTVKLAYTGVCGADGPCTHKDCGPLAVCKQIGHLAECECVSCGSEYEPVCGSDGVSYSNLCRLKREACLKNKRIDVLYPGLCDGCESKKCEFHATCVTDGAGEARCVCNNNCSAATGEQVCGTDGITYKNECELKLTACQNKMNIQVQYKGDCESCAGVVCQYKATCMGGHCVCPRDCSAAPLEQVCGSNLVTYESQCELQKRGCELNDATLDVLFYGSCERRSHRPVIGIPVTTPLSTSFERNDVCRDVRCDFDATCEPDAEGYPRCVCLFGCGEASPGEAVCGSDLTLYPSSCHMKAEACARQTDIRARPIELCHGMEVKPCGGDKPLADPDTGEDLDCGNGHNRQDCPMEYYCHQTSTFAKCCRKESGTYLKDCEDSWFGCCPDGKTPSHGPGNEGCPEDCGCNKIGSYSGWCDEGQCKCRPGVGGPKCDRCQSGFWGLPKISSGHRGCLPCGCSLFGSVRDDCEQMTGKCVCKPGVRGDKCDTCSNSKHILTSAGCVNADSSTPVPTSCSQVVCYFGAVCEERHHRASCVCSATCPVTDKQQVVCGSDGQTYGSECHLLLYACKYQIDIAVVSLGACKDPAERPAGVTDSPSKRWTSYSLMASPQSKSTRHLLQEKYNLPGKNRDAYVIEGHVTSAASERGSLLREPCTYSEDCTLPETKCLGGICQCGPGFVENAEKTHCNKEEIPSFIGKSWLRLRHMKAYHKFSLELEFQTFNLDGILFYAQQHQDGTGDFIALAIINGYVVLSYNLGSGTVRVSSLVRVSFGEWHKVKVRRYQRDALLQVDSETPVPAQSQGSLVALDLSHFPYLGYVPTNHSRVFQNIGTEHGLVGCLKASHLEPDEDHLVSSCENNPCRNRPCLNGGTCLILEGQASCHCSHNFTGQFCEELLNPCAYSVCAPDTYCHPFEGGGFNCDCSTELDPNCLLGDPEIALLEGETLVLPRLEGVSRAMSIEIWFKSFSPDGSIIYNGQSSHPGRGDYLSLALEGGNLVFSYSLGGNPATIRANESITVNSWHVVHISRTDKEGTLRLDSNPIHRGLSGGDHFELNLEQPLYIGKPPGMEDAPTFSGAIQKFIINGDRMFLASLIKTSLYEGEPCVPGACAANQTCVPALKEFKCICGLGTSCSNELSNGDDGVYFDGNTVVKYPRKLPRKNGTNYEEDELYEGYNEFEEVEAVEEDEIDEDPPYQEDYDPFDDERRSTHLEMWVRTDQSDAPLLVSKSPKVWGLLISEGRIVLNARIQEKHIILSSKVQVDDGNWHHVVAVRRKRNIHVRVDQESPIRMATGQAITSAKRFWIGGCPSLPEDLPEVFYSRFKGCLRSVKIDRRNVDLMSLSGDLEPCDNNSVR